MAEKARVIFRADGNSKKGLGHVIRSLALADMLRDFFYCVFIIQEPTPALEAQIKDCCDELIRLKSSNNFQEEAQYLVKHHLGTPSIVVLDGYDFDTQYQKIIKSAGVHLVCIDDINAYHFVADVVINHAGGFTTDEYSTETYTKILLGPSYALLRPSFLNAAKNKTRSTDLDSIFICFGGADPSNDTLRVLQKCIAHHPSKKYHIILGSAFKHLESLEDFIRHTSVNVQLYSNISSVDMVALMQKCPAAITSPSTVSYEYLCTGGMLFLKVIADNQKRINHYLISQKLAFDFEEFQNIELLSSNSEALEALFDGEQKRRYLKVFLKMGIELKRATEDDVELYFRWANDPLTRAQSFSSDPIPWDEHCRWFESRIQSKDHIFYKATIGTTAVGQIRYDLKTNEALINYSVDPEYRGFGIGSYLIEKTKDLIPSCFDIEFEIVGFVKYENEASARVFRKLGFKEEISKDFKETYRYVLRCKK